MDKFKEIIENKKQKSASRKPRYGTRKLSIGLVSCVLGYAMLISPSVALADEANETETAIEESSVPTNAPEEENTEETEPTTSTKETTQAETSEEKSQATVPETSSKEESTGEAEKAPVENPTTDAEKANEEEPEKKLVTLDEYNALQEENAEANADAEELEISEEADPEALQAGETEEDAITNVKITIGGAKNGENTKIVNPTADSDRIDTTDTDLNLETNIKFDIPEGTKAGRYFDVEISDNVNFNGIVREEEITPIDYNGEIIATGEKLTDGRRGYRYTFNDKIDNLEKISINLEYPLFIDPETVPNNSEKETITVKVAGKEISKNFKVEYENGVFDYVQGGPTLSGSANITDVTSDTYEHIIYVNPTADQEVKNPHILIQNQEGYSTATFDDEVKNSVKVYRIKNTDDFNLSYHLDYNNLEEVTANVEVVEDLFGPGDAPKQLKVDINNGDFSNDVYVITYQGKREAKKATKTLVEFTADRRKFTNENGKVIETGATNADFGWKWRNEILFDDPDAGATGEEKPTDPVEETYSLGDRVWIDDNKDGIQTDGEKGVSGVKVTISGDNLSEGYKTETTTDANGNYKFEGLKNGEYKITFEVPEGYEVTKTDEGTDDKIDSDGKEVTATIKDADNMSVDLGLVKQEAPVENTYSLGDRVWLDDNKDGIQTDGEKGVEGVTVTLTGGDLKEAKTTTTDANGNYKFEGLKNGDYKVTFEIPEGYEVTKTDEGTDDEKDSDGKEVTATIKDADNMSVDLGLIKKETPTTPTPSEPKEPTVPSTPDEPTLPSTPEEPEETTPLIPLTPADPVEKVENDDETEVEKPEEGKSEETNETEVVKQPEKVERDNVEPVKVPNRSKTGNPKTGISSSLGLVSTLAASALAFLGLDDKKRKNK